MSEILLVNIAVLSLAFIFSYLSINLDKQHLFMKTVFLIFSLGLLVIDININIGAVELSNNAFIYDSLILVYEILNIAIYLLIAYYFITILTYANNIVVQRFPKK